MSDTVVIGHSRDGGAVDKLHFSICAVQYDVGVIEISGRGPPVERSGETLVLVTGCADQFNNLAVLSCQPRQSGAVHLVATDDVRIGGMLPSQSNAIGRGRENPEITGNIWWDAVGGLVGIQQDPDILAGRPDPDVIHAIAVEVRDVDVSAGPAIQRLAGDSARMIGAESKKAGAIVEKYLEKIIGRPYVKSDEIKIAIVIQIHKFAVTAGQEPGVAGDGDALQRL